MKRWDKHFLLFDKFFLRPTVSKLLMILMIWGCANDVHHLIIKIIDNSKIVDPSIKKIAVDNPRVRAIFGGSQLSELWKYFISIHLSLLWKCFEIIQLSELWKCFKFIQLSELWKCFEIIQLSLLTIWSKSASRGKETCSSQSLCEARKIS